MVTNLYPDRAAVQYDVFWSWLARSEACPRLVNEIAA